MDFLKALSRFYDVIRRSVCAAPHAFRTHTYCLDAPSAELCHVVSRPQWLWVIHRKNPLLETSQWSARISSPFAGSFIKSSPPLGAYELFCMHKERRHCYDRVLTALGIRCYIQASHAIPAMTSDIKSSVIRGTCLSASRKIAEV